MPGGGGCCADARMAQESRATIVFMGEVNREVRKGLRSPFRIAHKIAMLPLGAAEFPKDNASLHAALAHGIAQAGTVPPTIVLDGQFPSLAAVRIDLTGSRFHRGQSPVVAPAGVTGGFFARTVDVQASPASLEQLAFTLSLRAEDCAFAFGTAPDGGRVAVLQSSSGGHAEIKADVADIENAVTAIAGEAASEHGASIQSVRVSLEAETPRRLAVTVTATAKAMMFTTTVTIRGLLRITDDLALQFGDLTCTGDGMIGNLAAGQLRPQLARLADRQFPLTQALPGGLACTRVEFRADGALTIKATFGSAQRLR